MRKLLAFVLLAFALAVPAIIAADDPPEDLEGIYTVIGKDVTSDYNGCAVIRKHGERYLVQSSLVNFVDGEMKHANDLRGIGILQGDTLSVAWKNGDGVGITVYEISKDGLRGRYTTFPGPKNISHETMKRIGPLPKSQLEI